MHLLEFFSKLKGKIAKHRQRAPDPDQNQNQNQNHEQHGDEDQEQYSTTNVMFPAHFGL